jgi:hypothetical protein
MDVVILGLHGGDLYDSGCCGAATSSSASIRADMEFIRLVTRMGVAIERVGVVRAWVGDEAEGVLGLYVGGGCSAHVGPPLTPDSAFALAPPRRRSSARVVRRTATPRPDVAVRFAAYWTEWPFLCTGYRDGRLDKRPVAVRLLGLPSCQGEANGLFGDSPRCSLQAIGAADKYATALRARGSAGAPGRRGPDRSIVRARRPLSADPGPRFGIGRLARRRIATGGNRRGIRPQKGRP